MLLLLGWGELGLRSGGRSRRHTRRVEWRPQFAPCAGVASFVETGREEVAALPDAQFCDRLSRKLRHVMDTGLGDLDDLLCDHFR